MAKPFRITPYRLFQHGFERLNLDGGTLILVIASFVGILAGFGAIAFRSLTEAIQTLAIGDHSSLLQAVAAMPWYQKLLTPVAGGLVIGPLVYFFCRETQGTGVPEVMEAVALRGGRIRKRVMVVKMLVSALTLGTGGSVGREGPIIQIGSSMGSALSQWLKVNPNTMKLLVSCGAAAGIAATFNAPIAGVIFAVEIILGNYAIATLLPLMMASVMATIVGRWYFGDYPAFVIPHYELGNALEVGPYILLGLLSGVAAVAFSRVVYGCVGLAEKVPLPQYLKTPLIMFGMGGLIILFPNLYGVGYDTITQVLHGDIVWYILLALVPAKMLASGITLAAGGSGGIFAPSLFLGAVFGGAFGFAMQALFPGIVQVPEAFAVVGMSAMVAGTTHGPIAAFLVIFEMTGDYKLILPLMLASILASFVASRLQKDSVYTRKLSRRGVNLSRGMEVSIMQATRVRDVMDPNVSVLRDNTGFDTLLNRVIDSNEAWFYVTDDQGACQGSFNINQVKQSLHDTFLAGLVLAKDVVSLPPAAAIEQDATLAAAMKKFSVYDADELPVIDTAVNRRLVARVSRRDILNVYNREILQQGALGVKIIHARTFDEAPVHSHVDLPEGFATDQIPVDATMWGRGVQDLDIRRRFGVTVVAVNRKGEGGKIRAIVPEAEFRFKKGDQLILLGRTNDLERFRSECQT